MSELKLAIQWDQVAGLTQPQTQYFTEPKIKFAMDLVREEYAGQGELLDSFLNNDIVGVIDGIGDCFKVLCSLCYMMSIDPEEVLAEINNSNFSKFCTTEDDAKLSVKSYENDTRYYDVHYVKVGSLYIIKGWKTGYDKTTSEPKVLKGIHFKEPDLYTFIKKEC